MKIVCSECGRDFEPRQKMLKERPLPAGFIEVYFSCPHCGIDFRVALHNEKTKKLQKKIRKARNEESVNQLKAELKSEMDRINGK